MFTSCDNCDLELNGDFTLSKFDYLTKDEHDFIECFLKYQGNFKLVQNERGMSYPATKKSLVNILEKLNLNASDGQAMVTLYNGDACDIWFDENGKGLVSAKIPPANQQEV